MDLSLLKPNFEVLNHEDWFQCSFKEFSTNKHKELSNVAGIYIFYWTGKLEELEKLSRKIRIQGKAIKKHLITDESGKHESHKIEFLTSWFPDLGENRFALYVGKSTNIFQRFNKHQYRKTIQHEDWLPKNDLWLIEKSNYKNPEHFAKIYKPTTASQFRSGWQSLVRLLSDEAAEKLLTENVSFAFLPVHEVAKRFYLEDYLIGTLRPWFNLDSER